MGMEQTAKNIKELFALFHFYISIGCFRNGIRIYCKKLECKFLVVVMKFLGSFEEKNKKSIDKVER